MKKYVALLLAMMMVFALCACAASDDTAESDQPTFVMGIDPEYPPFSYLGDDGEYTGFDVEVCKAACDLLGWNFEVFGVNWDESWFSLPLMNATACGPA